ncbi:uncharacterized protein LOC109977106 isoform X2 [Arapaima gigas]
MAQGMVADSRIVLLQGFTESPSRLFRALKQYLSDDSVPAGSTLIQYIDGLPVASPPVEDCKFNAIAILSFLLKNKLQLWSPTEFVAIVTDGFLTMHHLLMHCWISVSKPSTPGPLPWTLEADFSFDSVKCALSSAPALALPVYFKAFVFFSHEHRGFAQAVLM